MKKIAVTSSKEKQVKTAKNIQQRLLAVVVGDRRLNIHTLLEHELSVYPPSLFKPNKSMIPTNKATLSHILIGDTSITKLPKDANKKVATIIDGMALLQRIGKPKHAQTFGDLANVFVKQVLSHFSNVCNRVDVVFDRYISPSIKSCTRLARSHHARPIRKIISNRFVPLPVSWMSFLSLPTNKQNLVDFLSVELLQISRHSIQDDQVVIVGGFADGMAKHSAHCDVLHLQSQQQEADTRMGYSDLVFVCDDTGVLVLLIWHDDAPKVWMLRSNPVRFIPIHVLRSQLTEPVHASILGFHSLTGCDSTSQFNGHAKKTAWKVYTEQPELLKDLGSKANVDSDMYNSVEKFVALLYQPSTISTTLLDIRVKLFHQGKTFDKYPPTKDVLWNHVQRSNYQSLIWQCAKEQNPTLPPPTQCGWQVEGDDYIPIMSTIDPFPEHFLKIANCNCKQKLQDSNSSKKACQGTACSCKKANVACTPACNCFGRACATLTTTRIQIAIQIQVMRCEGHSFVFQIYIQL